MPAAVTLSAGRSSARIKNYDAHLLVNIFKKALSVKRNELATLNLLALDKTKARGRSSLPRYKLKQLLKTTVLAPHLSTRTRARIAANVPQLYEIAYLKPSRTREQQAYDAKTTYTLR